MCDRLASGDLDDAERGELAQRLAGYVDVAEQRCEQLRAQLPAVVVLTEQLRREVRSTRRRRSLATGR